MPLLGLALSLTMEHGFLVDSITSTCDATNIRREEPPAGPQRYVHEADQRRYLDERPHHRGKGLARADAKGRDGHRDRKLKVVASCSELEGGGCLVVETQTAREPEGEPEHHRKIDEQRQRDPKHV